jgi:branched-chain amino acid aminotransferase
MGVVTDPIAASHLELPEDAELFLLSRLRYAAGDPLAIDRAWLPTLAGTSLYLRPTMIATEPALGVRPADEYLFFIVMCPVGAYYPEGFNPTRIYVSDSYVRAAPGGVGETKTSGNYGPTLFVSQQAAQNGYTQVLWLDARERKYVEEVGTSNVFFIIDDVLVTPPLGGTILAGVTRDSVLHLARQWGLTVADRPITIDEVITGCKRGAVTEAFATGTAAVISPIGEIGYKGEDFQVADGQVGELSQKLYDVITGIQYGRIEDPFNWRVRVA